MFVLFFQHFTQLWKWTKQPVKAPNKASKSTQVGLLDFQSLMLYNSVHKSMRQFRATLMLT